MSHDEARNLTEHYPVADHRREIVKSRGLVDERREGAFVLFVVELERATVIVVYLRLQSMLIDVKCLE
jgi:hypothetical protein